MCPPTFVFIAVVLVIPFDPNLMVSHSTNMLTMTAVAIQDKWSSCLQYHWIMVILVIPTTVLDYCVFTIIAIWQYAPLLVPIMSVFIIPFNSPRIKTTRASPLLSDAVSPPRPADTTSTTKCLHTVVEADVSASVDSQFMFNPPALIVFVTIIF